MRLNRARMRVLMLAMAAVFALMVLASVASFAGREGRINTAATLTGVSAYLLSKGKTEAGLLTAVGAAIAWDNVNDRDHHRRYYYRDRDCRDRDRYYYRDRDRWYYDRDRDRRYDRDCDRNWKKHHKRHDNGLHRGWDRNRW